MIHCSDSLEFLKQKKDFQFDIYYADVPYALGSEIYIRSDGKPDYKKATDFMNKWKMPDGNYWENWFKEAFRTLKHGGYCIMFGIDRQLLLFKYYAQLAGFSEKQSLYWYFISNFPKATDLSKMIDKNIKLNETIIKEKQELGQWLKQKRGNLPQKEISKHFLSKTGGLTGCVANWELGLGLPTWGIWSKLKMILDLDDRYDYLIEARPKNTIEAEREVIGKNLNGAGNGSVVGLGSKRAMETEFDITKPSTDLAKKYEGYKYSISPLKQTNETIMVFQKPYKTGSCLHDTLAYENGDETCCCNALNIDGNRVEYTVDNPPIPQLAQQKLEVNSSKTMYDGHSFNKSNTKAVIGGNLNGRYPSQTFIDSHTGEILDKQSGNLKGGGAISKHQQNNESELNFTNGDHSGFEGFDDEAGCAKILHKCDFESGEFDLYHYVSKVSQFERNAGCELNNHPTLKPISLNFKILSLFKSPNKQQICYPFAGSGSEIIGGLKAGFEDYDACEINQEYIEIANARIKYWREVDFDLNKENHDKNIQNSNTIELTDLF